MLKYFLPPPAHRTSAKQQPNFGGNMEVALPMQICPSVKTESFIFCQWEDVTNPRRLTATECKQRGKYLGRELAIKTSSTTRLMLLVQPP